MSSRSRGLWASLFGAGTGGGDRAAAPLFPPRPRPPASQPPAALPPAPAPGIAIGPPRPEAAVVPMPADVPPPASGAASMPRRHDPGPLPTLPALAAPGRDQVQRAQSVGALPAPAPGALAATPTVLASVLETLPAPLPHLAAAAPEPPPEHFVELTDIAPVSVAVAQPGFWGGRLLRLALAPPATPAAPMPLIEGTERFTDDFLIGLHQQPSRAAPREIALTFATDAIITGPGHIWLDGKLVTAPELMPEYVYEAHRIAENGPELLGAHSLPLREIVSPCVVLIGHGLHVYGHFVIEMLFRVLLVRRALHETGLAVQWLLDASAPAWLLRILHDDLGISPEQIEFFRATEERVRLRHAILPGLVHAREGFHPFTRELLDDLLRSLAPLPEVTPARHLFIARRGFRNAHSDQRACENETTLVELAEARGFKAIAAEELPWRQQLALFRNAEVVVGPFGSALHTALVSGEGTRVGVVGVLNTTQSEIAALCRHRVAYLTNGFRARGQFTVPESEFVGLLDRLASPSGRQQPAAPPSRASVAPQVPAFAPVPSAVPIPRAVFGQARIGRYVVAPAAPPRAAKPLLPGTEEFAAPSQRALHRDATLPMREAVCYFAEDVVVSSNRVWLDGEEVAAPELVGQLPRPASEPGVDALPVRDIEGPCVVIAGAAENPANVIAEVMPRVQLARRAIYDSGDRIRLLVDGAAPAWLMRLVLDELGFKNDELEPYAPKTERVRLRRAILPGVVAGAGGYHPIVDQLIERVIDRLTLPEVPQALRLFVQRPLSPNADPEAPRGDCENEAALVAFAKAQYGIVPITLDDLPWAKRVAHVRKAQLVLLAPGVAANSMLLAPVGTRIAAIASRGSLVGEICALRGHSAAYFSEGVPPKGPFTIQEGRFAEFLGTLCNAKAKAHAA